MNIVSKKGRIISYYAPYIPIIKTHRGNQLHSIPERRPEREAEGFNKGMREADCMVSITNHSAFDAQIIHQHAHLVVDLRNKSDKL